MKMNNKLMVIAFLLSSLCCLNAQNDAATLLFSEAIAKCDARDYAGAVSAYERYIALVPDNAKAYYNCGNVRIVLKDYAAAIQDFNHALTLDAEYAKAYQKRAFAKLSVQDTVGALADYRTAAAKDPANADIAYNVGNLMQKNDPAQAQQYFDKAILLKADHTAALVARANHKLATKDYAGAQTDYTQSINMAPKTASAYFGRAMAYTAQQEWVKAIMDFSKSIELNYKVAQSYLQRGNAKLAVADYRGAVADYDTVLSHDPSNQTALNNRGIAHSKLGNTDASANDLKKLTGTNDIDALMNLAQLAYQQQDYEAAIKHYDNVLGVNEKEQEALLYRGLSYAKLGKEEKALRDYERVIALNPANQEAYLLKGKLLLDSKAYDDAIAELTKVINKDKKAATAYYYRGVAYYQLKKKEQGCTDLSKAGELGLSVAYEAIQKHCQ